MKVYELKGTVLSLIAVAGLLVSLAGTAGAATTAASKDEKKLTVGITMLNNAAKLPQGEKVMTKQLTDEFGVKSDKISSLKAKNLKYGEIAAVLAMADKMEGGISDANINRVVGMRPATAGWDRIANSLKVDLAEVAEKVYSFEGNVHESIKEAAVEAAETGRGAGGGEEGGFLDEMGGSEGGTSSGGTGGSIDESGSAGGSGGSSY